MLGGISRRAWRVNWLEKDIGKLRYIDQDEREALQKAKAELIVQWADFLPFVVATIRICDSAPPPGFVNACDSFFSLLPGRLKPDNRLPTAEAQSLFMAKISSERLAQIRAPPSTENAAHETIRLLEQGLLLPMGSISQATVQSPFPNVLYVEGVMSRFIDGPGRRTTVGPIRAFIFSHGNLGHAGETLMNLPFWIPPGMGLTGWNDFNFHPFLHASIRHARHVAIEAGRLDEAFSRLAIDLNLAHGKPAGPAKELEIQHEIGTLQAGILRLQVELHQGAARSPATSETIDSWGNYIEHEFQDLDAWPLLFGTNYTTAYLKETKVDIERESSQILEGLARRIGAVLDLVVNVQSNRINASIRQLTKATVGLALVATLVGIGSLLATLWGMDVI